MTSTSGALVVPTERYTSLQLLREAHALLLEREQVEQGQPAFVADVRRFLQLGQATGALIERRADRRAAQSLLDYWAAGLSKPGVAQSVITLDSFDELAAPTLPDQPAPYIGLDAFDEATEDRFFGRSEIISEMLQRLQAGRMLAVVGSSGSGKSSIVRAGVLAQLRHMATQESVNWQLLPPVVPGSDPISALVRTVYQATPALRPAEGRPSERTRRIIAGLANELRMGRASIVQLIDSWIARPTVLTIDQFEEIFTLCRDERTREVFVANLVKLLDHPQLPHRLILTMRSDFEAKVALLPQLKLRFDAARIQVTALSITQLREVIEGPAQRVGLVFDDGIVDDLVGHALGETAALPLLQFTLSRLWELRTRNRVQLETYRSLGGMARALSTSADAWYQQLIPEDQRTARRIFLELVRPADPVIVATEAFYKGERRQIDRVLSEGLEVTRSRVRVADLYRSGEDPDRINRVLASMDARRLVCLSQGDTDDDDQVEVAHEALIRNWETLQGWIEQDYERLRQRGRLIEAASQWERNQQNPDLLWRGSQLEDARRTSVGIQDPSVVAFLKASQAEEERLRQQQRAADEQINEAKRREAEEREQAAEARAAAAETARQRAEDRASHMRRLRIWSLILTLLTFVTGITTLLAFNWAIQAQNEAFNANAQGATARAEATNAAAVRSTAESGQQTAMAAAATAVQDRASLRFVQATVLALNSVQQTQIALLGGAGVTQATVIAQQLAEINDLEITNFLAEAKSLVDDHSVSPQVIQNLIADGLTVVKLSPQNTEIIDGLQTVIQRAEELPSVNRLITSTMSLTSVSWSPDASQIVIAGGRLISVWSVDTRSQRMEIVGHSGLVQAVAWSDDSSRVATASNDRTINIWNTADWSKVQTLKGHQQGVRDLAWSPDGKRIVSADGSEIIVWDSVSGAVLGRVLALGEQLTQAAWSPNGTNFITAGSGLRLRDGQTGATLLVGGEGTTWTSAAWSPDGQRIVTVSAAGETQIWNVAGFRPDRSLIRDGGFKGTAAMWNPIGDSVVVGGESGVVRIYESGSGRLVSTLRGHQGPVTAVAWSPDGMSIMSVGRDNTVRIFYTYPETVIEHARQIQKQLEDR